MESIILVGYGGHAKSVADSIKRQNKYNIVGYTDIKDSKCEYKYWGTDDMLIPLYKSGIKNAAIGIGYLGKGTLREKLYVALKEIGYNLPLIVDPTAIISESAHIHEGTFIGKNSIINADASIGCCCIINTGAIVEHECRVGDFTHVAVSSVLCGQVNIGKSCLVGANATIIQCVSIADRTIVPAGEVVRRQL